jgi:hypothetical protein
VLANGQARISGRLDTKKVMNPAAAQDQAA